MNKIISFLALCFHSTFSYAIRAIGHESEPQSMLETVLEKLLDIFVEFWLPILLIALLLGFGIEFINKKEKKKQEE